jgi:hypothetical protein
MSHYAVKEDWLTLKIKRALRHDEYGTNFIGLVRSSIFIQMLEPPLWDGEYTILEGRKRFRAEQRLKDLDIPPLCYPIIQMQHGHLVEDPIRVETSCEKK